MERSDDESISKTRRKKDATALQDVGAALVKLSREQLARIDMPEDLREAILECRRFSKHEAIRRQMQYIGRIMRGIDAAPIAEQLAALEAPSKRQTALFHVAEKWRDELLADATAVERFAREFPRADARRVQALAEAARAERPGKGAPKQARQLFHVVNAVVQAGGRPASDPESKATQPRGNRGPTP
jgi:ribosome-associated protein